MKPKIETKYAYFSIELTKIKTADMILLKKKIQGENGYEEIQKGINNTIDVYAADHDCNASFSKCGKAEQNKYFTECRKNLHAESNGNQGKNYLEKQ